MRPKLAGRYRARARDRVVRGLSRGLERASGTSPVIVPEYSLEPRARWGWSSKPPAALAALLAAGEEGYEPTIDGLLALEPWARTVPVNTAEPSSGPCWDDAYWGGVDALAQVAALRARDPATYLEIGSGNSTRFARRAVADFGLRTRIVSVDPEPRAAVDALCDEVHRRPAQDLDPAVFTALGAGDILLIDGSHTAFMNSDSTVLLLEVLPELAPGVLVCIHDVFLPWDYPPSWEHRFYSEQYLVAALLLGGAQGWAIRFPAWHVTRVSALAERLAPVWDVVEGRFGRAASSFWMERTK